MKRRLINLLTLLMLICMGSTDVWAATGLAAVNDATNELILHVDGSSVPLTFDSETGGYTVVARMEIHSEFYFTDSNGIVYGSSGGDDAYVTPSTTPTLQPNGEPFYSVSGAEYSVTLNADLQMSVSYIGMVDIDPGWEINGETTAMDNIIGTKNLGKFEPNEFTITQEQLDAIGGAFKFCLRNYAMNRTYMADTDHRLITSTNCTNLPLHYSYTDSPYTYYFEIRQPGTYRVFLNYNTTKFNLSVESDWPTAPSYKLGRTRTTVNGTNTNYYPIYYDEDTGTYKLTVQFLLQKGDIYWIEDAEGNQYGGNGSTTLSSSSPEISLLNLEDDGQLLQWASPPCEHLSMTVDESGLPYRLKGNIWAEPGIYLFGNPSGWEYKNKLKFVERYGHPGEYMFTGYIEGGGGQFYISKMDEDGSGNLYTSPYESLSQENSTDVPMSGGYAFTVPEGYYTLILNFNETTPTITISGWPGYYLHGMATEMWSYLNEYKFTEVADMPGIYRLTAEIKQPKFGSTTFFVADKKLENSQSATSCFLGATTTSGSGTLVLTEDNATNVPLTLDGNSFEMGLGSYTFELNTNSDTPTLSVVGWGNEQPTSTYEMAYDYSLPGWVFEYDAETDSYFTVQTVEAGKEFWVDIDGGEIHCTHTGNMVIDKNHPTDILLVPNGDGGTLTMPESGTYTFRFKVTANGLLFSVEWPVPNYYLTDEIWDDNTGGLVERKIPFTYKGDGVYELNDIEFEQDHSFWFKRELNGEDEYYGNITGDLTVTPKDMNLVISSWHTSGNLSMGLAGTYSLIINEQDGSSILTVRFPMQQITIAYDFSERGAFTYDAATNTYSLEFTADAGKPIWFLNKTQGSIIQVPEEITLDRNNSNNISLIEGDDANSLYLSNGGRFTFKLKPTDNGYLLNVVWPEPDYMLTYGPTSPGYNSSTPFTRNGDGNWTLEVNFADAPDLLDEINEKDLLFTGTGYSVEEIYFVDEGVKVPVWTNDGWLGEINWSSKYRFGGIRLHALECCYIFPQDVWEKMKSNPFFVTIKGASPSIRITTGWWNTNYTASLIEPGYDKLTRNGDGCWTAELTVTEDWANDNLFTIGVDDLSLCVDGVSTMYGYGVPYDYSHPTNDKCQNIPLVCGDGSYCIKLPAGTYPFTINPDHTLSIDWPFEQQKFYIAGTMTNNYDWLNMEEMVYNEQANTFEYEFTVEDSPVFFSITDKMLEENDEAHWNDMNANHRYAPAFDYATELTQINTPIQLQKQKGEMKITVPGTYKISLDSDFKLSVTGWTEQTTDMVNIITNGDLEGDDMSCFFKVESPSVDAVPATYTAGAGKNGSRGIVIQSNDNPTNEWDTQFLIRLPQTLPAGTTYRISFDCKASQTASGTSQIHAEPQQYITWDAFGSVNFTTEWQHFEATGTLTDAQSPENNLMRTFCILLANTETANNYYFDNIVIEIDKNQVVPFAVVEEAPTAKDLTYTGSAQELVNPGDASGGTMQYSLDGTNYSPDIPTGTDVGEYIVYYKVVGDADHSDTEPATVSVTIEEAGQEIELTDISQLENTIYLEPHDIRTGSQSTLSFKMKNNVPIRGFQFDLYMPEGLTTATSSNGKVLASLDATRLPEGDEHQLTISIQDDGAIRFLCNSQYDENFATGDDIVLTLKVDVSEDMPEGDYPIDLKKIKLSESNINNSYPTSLVRSKVTVSSYVPGDVNGDGEVDISDYISVANYIHGNSADGFIFKAGDVNGDGEIDITDYIGISNIIHTGSPSGNSQAGAKAAVFLPEESQELDPE